MLSYLSLWLRGADRFRTGLPRLLLIIGLTCAVVATTAYFETPAPVALESQKTYDRPRFDPLWRTCGTRRAVP